MWSSPGRRAARRSRPVSRETEPWVGVADELGHPLSTSQIDLLRQFRHWLTTEAVRAGAIGPYEVERVDARHLADSLLYRTAFDGDEVWDLGTGAGLPGIPLAIMVPETSVVLVDRSGRRVSLLRRVVRILDLANVEVRQAEISRIQGPISVVVSRASLPPGEMSVHMDRMLEPGGVAVLGGSWVAPPVAAGWETREVWSGSLDRRVWLLIMRRQ
jgi:16S rRNA (guanine(527)-N(7))-methyltransferase RsmG